VDHTRDALDHSRVEGLSISAVVAPDTGAAMFPAPDPRSPVPGNRSATYQVSRNRRASGAIVGHDIPRKTE